jgi:hypothetical protein
MRASDVLEHGFSENDQRRIADLSRKSSEGSLTDDERHEYETYLRVGELLSTLRAKERQRVRLQEQTRRLPPRGDPRRPLYLSVRSIKVLALVLLLLGGDLFFAFAHINAWLASLSLAPGILHLVLAAGLYHKQRWALVAAIAFACVQVVAAVVGLVLSLVFHSHLLVIVGMALWLAAVIQLLLHLRC